MLKVSIAAKCNSRLRSRCCNCPSVSPKSTVPLNDYITVHAAQAAKLLAVRICGSYQLHDIELSLLSQLQFSTAVDYFAPSVG